MKKITQKEVRRFNYHLKELEKLSEKLGLPILSPIFTTIQYFMLTPGGKDGLVELTTICTGYVKFYLSLEKKKAVKGTKTIQ